MLPIYGLEKSSLLDYPGKVCAVVFLYGCNLRCSYCHNPELVVEECPKSSLIKKEDVLKFLEKRIGKLDAVVITGGEPLIHPELLNFIKDIKKLGYLVKIDTNGLLPNSLRRYLNSGYIDYVAMDVKYPIEEYNERSGNMNAQSCISESISIILNSNVDYEFRTTYVKGIHNDESVRKICEMIKGSKRYYIQNFREGKSIDQSLSIQNSFTPEELKTFKKIALGYIPIVEIR
jgi:pyruvate formate lyase activating enzyme